MALLASQVLTKVRRLLQDTDANNYRWSDADLLIYLSDAQRETVRLRPDAKMARSVVQLTAGKTVQTGLLPAGAIEIVSVTRNMGVAGLTPGNTISKTTEAKLSLANRAWHTAIPAAAIDQWAPAEEDPTGFYCSPPAHAVTAVYVEVAHSTTPMDLTALTDTVDVREIYETPLQLFVLGSALQENKLEGNPSRGAQFMAAFYASLGRRPEARSD